MNRVDKIAREIVGYKIDDKKDFISFISISIQRIHFVFEDGLRLASEENLEINFEILKSKIFNWCKETEHIEPFYPREFLKNILNGSTLIDHIERIDAKSKMQLSEFNLDTSEKLKEFILSRIDNDNEENGLKFKDNKMNLSLSGMPLDVYNALIEKDTKKYRIYFKFYITHDFCDAYFKMTVVSFHNDLNQPENK